MKSVVLVGEFRSRHGAAAVTQEMLGICREVVDCEPKSIDVGVSASGFRFAAKRVAAHLRAAVWLLGTKSDLAYFQLPAGRARFLVILPLLAARVRRTPVALHHHSSAYLQSRHLAQRLVHASAGSRASHFVLCDCMGEQLERVYGVKRTLVVDNRAFVRTRGAETEHSPSKQVGMLANLSVAKGALAAIELVAAHRRSGTSLSLALAGPVDEADVQIIESAVARADDWAMLVGPLYDDEKWEFLRSLSGFVFLSCYVNEAAPLSVLEALAVGLPTLVNPVGCLKDQLRVEPMLYNADDATERAEWLSQVSSSRSVSFVEAARQADLRTSARNRVAVLVDNLLIG